MRTTKITWQRQAINHFKTHPTAARVHLFVRCVSAIQRRGERVRCGVVWVETPVLPGKYVWTMDGRYEILEVVRSDSGKLYCGLLVEDMDGWWCGPLPEPMAWVRLPRVFQRPFATRPKRQQVSQAESRRLMGLDASGRATNHVSPNGIHRHSTMCPEIGCLAAQDHRCGETAASSEERCSEACLESESPAGPSIGRSTQPLSRGFPLSVATNDQNQPVCGADLFSESTAHANSAAFYC